MAHYNFGITLFGRVQVEAAIAEYRKAISITPRYVTAHNNLGLALAGQGKVDEAMVHFRRALEIQPRAVLARYNLGFALASQGRFDEAIENYREAIEIEPNLTQARQALDDALLARERLFRMLAQRRELLRLRPDDVGLLNDTAWLLATNPNASIRDGATAVELAQRAVQLSNGQQPAILGTLAAAYAEARRFPEALQTAQKALGLATQQNNRPLAASIKAKILLYEVQRPFRELQSSPSKTPTPP